MRQRASNYPCIKATDSHDSLRQIDLTDVSCPGWTPKTALFKAVRHIAASNPVRHDSSRQLIFGAVDAPLPVRTPPNRTCEAIFSSRCVQTSASPRVSDVGLKPSGISGHRILVDEIADRAGRAAAALPRPEPGPTGWVSQTDRLLSHRIWTSTGRSANGKRSHD